MKICVVTPRFAISGVPLAQIRFAQALANNGHEVDLIIGYVNAGLVMPDADGVNVVILNRHKYEVCCILFGDIFAPLNRMLFFRLKII